jgi:peptide/nickel transport system ATP-binding protein
MTPPPAPALTVRDLTVEFATERGPLTAVDRVSFAIAEGKATCLVGESGCGKSMTALAILRLVPPPGRITAGEIFFHDRDLLKLSERELRKLRGDELSIIFQEPMTALNPVFTIGTQVVEVIRTHQDLGRRAAREKAIQVMEMVGMPGAERFDAYPHELSGGMRQRVMIAIALACRPTLLIADEPTTALDVTIQAQILDLLSRLQQDLGMAVLLITHDLSVVAEFADDVAVMYAGQVVETAPAASLFSVPRHPYTQALLESVPRRRRRPGERLATIPGAVPDLLDLPAGCRFADRCPRVFEPCTIDAPDLRRVDDEHRARCFLVEP